ncbi:MAG: serine/threonine protein kinase [Actinomycetota bacterium]|nr:serine/threonine protein kinase [Actinomycetota bacterium]MDQ6947100.1 serine/threonine protein kinase [Actinomycetota bacterium]
MERIADYSLLQQLGEGNYGEFYLATPPDRLKVNAEYVAVKVLAGRTTEDAFRRATKELRLFAAVQSPYLVSLFDAGQEGETFYYSMEFFPLGSLDAPARPLDRKDTLRAVTHAARAAHALHEAGIVHRDIKPANIMLYDNGAKLSDLGLAQLVQPGLTVTGMGPVGSVEFMDPAIMRGARASRATDIWSLGVTLHRAMTGEGLYGELADNEPLLAMRKVLSATPTVDPSLRPAEAALIQACLAPDPADRPPTALAVAEGIELL